MLDKTICMADQLMKRLDRIDKKITFLLTKQMKETQTWVKAPVITKLTGWNIQQMRAARKNNYVKFKKENGMWYLLESLNENFKINNNKSS